MNGALNAPPVFSIEGVVFEDNTPVFQAQPLQIIKKSKGVTATTVNPVEGKDVYSAENNVKKTVCRFWFETISEISAMSLISPS